MPTAREIVAVAIVGASSLIGKELKLVIEDRSFPAVDVRLLDEEVLAGTLAEAAGEATFIRAVEEESFRNARFVFFASSAEFARRHRRQAQASGASIIDLSGALAAEADASLWIPALDPVLLPPGDSSGRLFRSPGAATIIAASLAAALAPFEPRRIALVLFEPASERGQPGVNELESQTTDLLSLRTIAHPVFGIQAAFNLLDRYGPGSVARLEDIRGGIVRDTLGYLGGRAVPPVIQLLAAPVFYGTAFTAFVEFAAPLEPTELEPALASVGFQIAADDDVPSNLSVAGKSEIMLSRVQPDASIAGGYWLWGAADNLRLAASNAVAIAEALLER